MDSGLLLVFLAFLVPGIYIAVNIPFSIPVRGTLEHFEEHDDYVGGDHRHDFNAVYSYPYNGWTRHYESHIGRIFAFTLQKEKTLYVRKSDGKVFELENAILLLGIALIMLVMNKFGMLH